MRLIALVAALSLLAACATAHDHAPAGQPVLTPAVGQPAPPQARFYADCIAAAAAAGSYDREHNTLRFQCSGAPAQRFYDGLAAWSAAHDTELTDGARTLRFTARPEHNISGLDFCWSEAGAYGCTVVLNIGEFLDAQ